MKRKNISGYICGTLLILLVTFFTAMAVKGEAIHEKICPKVKAVRIEQVTVGETVYTCLPRGCVKDGKVYEIYKQKGFFNDNIRVTEIAVSVMDIFPEEDRIAIISGILAEGRSYYALTEEDKLRNGQTIVIEKNKRQKD